MCTIPVSGSGRRSSGCVVEMGNVPARGVSADSRIGWWSANLSVLTGQAIVTSRVVALLEKADTQAFVYRGKRLKSIVSWVWAALRLGASLLARRVRLLYLVCSRSTAGFLRDMPAYLALLFGVRVLVHVHGSDIVDLCRRPGIGGIARNILARCELIVPSAHLLAPLRDLGLHRIHLCENFSEYIAPLVTSSPRTKQSERLLRVLWNSNVMASKGFFAVADAVKSLVDEGISIRLAVLGRPIGDEVMDLRTCQHALSQLVGQSWIEYSGPVDRSAAMRLLHEADVVCLPSRYSSECQPLAVIEAMCAGRQLVISDAPALRATVGDYPCEKVSDSVASEICVALRHVMERPASDEALQSAAAHARLRFSPERFDRDMARLLRI